MEKKITLFKPCAFQRCVIDCVTDLHLVGKHCRCAKYLRLVSIND